MVRIIYKKREKVRIGEEMVRIIYRMREKVTEGGTASTKEKEEKD